MTSRTRSALAAVAVLIAQAGSYVEAHSGPPFPVVTDTIRGPYKISVWTDPDATDDGTPGGRFWIVIATTARSGRMPLDTRATISLRPLPPLPPSPAVRWTQTEPVRGDITNQFGATVMDREGPYAVHVDVAGPLGHGIVDTMVDATYDLRPAPYMLLWYLCPFLLAGLLWARLLLRRRSVSRPPSPRASAGQARPSDRVHVP